MKIPILGTRAVPRADTVQTAMITAMDRRIFVFVMIQIQSVVLATKDTRPTAAIEEEAAGADLFICEGMYGEKGKEAKAREYRHMTFYEAAKLARGADVKELWLTHYSPSLTYPEEYMNDVRSIFPRAIAAKDGRTAELQFEEE